MSQIKRILEDEEALRGDAIAIAVLAGAIKECDVHSGTYLSCGDDDADRRAYAIGTTKIKNKELDYSREELMDAIKSAIDEAGEECYSCEKWHRS